MSQRWTGPQFGWAGVFGPPWVRDGVFRKLEWQKAKSYWKESSTGHWWHQQDPRAGKSHLFWPLAFRRCFFSLFSVNSQTPTHQIFITILLYKTQLEDSSSSYRKESIFQIPRKRKKKLSCLWGSSSESWHQPISLLLTLLYALHSMFCLSLLFCWALLIHC